MTEDNIKVNSYNPVLHLSSNNDSKINYAASEILNSLGINESIQNLDGDEDKLFINDILVASSDELLKYFDILTLERERMFGTDKHGRANEGRFDWDATEASFSDFILNIKEKLSIPVTQKKFKVIFSHDIDWVSSRVPVSIVKSLISIFETKGKPTWFSFSNALKNDFLFSNYSEILLLEKEYGVGTYNFLLSGSYGNGRYSNRYAIDWDITKKFMELILTSGNEIGLHGSYYASDRDSYKEEAYKIEKFGGVKVDSHRNHYLRFSSRELPNQLEKADIKFDFSVGYSSKIGFRAGSADIYSLFDFISDKTSNILEIPLIYMDRAYHINDQTNVLFNLRSILEDVKKYNGCVSILFHPSTFAVNRDWFKFYEEVIKMCLELGADVSGKISNVQH